MASARPLLALGAMAALAGAVVAAPPAKSKASPPAASPAPGKVQPDAPAGENAQQVVLNCDAITYQGKLDDTVSKELEPIHTLDGVGNVLTKHGVRFERSKQVVNINLPEVVREQIDSLPIGEPIVLPARGGGLICVIQPSSDSI